jgi:hypothetical protein
MFQLWRNGRKSNRKARVRVKRRRRPKVQDLICQARATPSRVGRVNAAPTRGRQRTRRMERGTPKARLCAPSPRVHARVAARVMRKIRWKTAATVAQ